MEKHLLKYYLLMLALFASMGLLWADSIREAVYDTLLISINDSLFENNSKTKENDVYSRITKNQQNEGAQLKKSSTLSSNVNKTMEPGSAKLSTVQTRSIEINADSLFRSQDTFLIKDSLQMRNDSVKVLVEDEKREDVKSKLCQIGHVLDAPVPQVLSEWVFPLVIMLFAFGFPLILDFITRIENKYNIEAISIAQSGAYKWYIWTLGIAISLSIIFCILLFVCQSGTIILSTLRSGIAIITFIASLILIIVSFLLVKEMFIYNDVNALKKKKKNALEKDFCSKDNIQIMLAIYDYAVKHENNDLLNNIEIFIKAQIDKYRKKANNLSKINSRKEIEYPDYLLEGLFSIYKNLLNDNISTQQNRLVQFICYVLFEKSEKIGVLPKTIISDSSLKYFWHVVKSTIDKKNSVAFSILWSNVSNYYKQLNSQTNNLSAQLRQEKVMIENMCFMIGAYSYRNKAFNNLQLILVPDLNKSEKLSLTHIEDILLQYYRCTGDFSTKVSDVYASFDEYKKYAIIEMSGASKKQQIEPLSLYASYLIHRIYAKGPYFLQFDPIKFVKELLWTEQKTFRPTYNLRDALLNINTDAINNSLTTDLKIDHLMSEDEVKTLWGNLVMQTEQQENIRLYHTPISKYWEEEFKKRFNIEWSVLSREPKNLCDIHETEKVDNVFSTTDTYNTSKQLVVQNEISFSDNLFTSLCPKKHFVYATYTYADDNQYGIAKKMAIMAAKDLRSKMADILIEMKEKQHVWCKTREKLLEKMEALTNNNQCSAIVYVPLKKDSEKVVESLLKGENYTSLGPFSTAYYNKVPIYIIPGKELSKEQYKSLKKSFIIIPKDNIPTYTYSKDETNIEYYIQYSDQLINGEAKLSISIKFNAKLKYKQNTAKVINVNF